MTSQSSEAFEFTISEAAGLIASKELSPIELTLAYLDRVNRLDAMVGAFTNLMSESALEQARQAEIEIRSGSYRGPLHGVPFAVKDQLDSAGAPSFMRGQKMADSKIDATAITRLKAAGAIYMGKLVMSGQPDVAQPRNPWDLVRITGGSSSGPAAGVAARFCAASLGEDSAGSIRIPASLCGLVGVIGTYGRISRFGLASMGWTLDHCGPLTWSVKDAAYILEAIAGYDARDRTTSRVPVPKYSLCLEGGIRGRVIGVPVAAIESPVMNVHPEILSAFRKALSTFESLGAKIVEVTLPYFEEATFVSFVIYIGEYAAEYMDQHEWISAYARDARLGRLGLGALTTASDYLHAQRLRSHMRQEYRKVFDAVDILATPSLATTAAEASSEQSPMSLWWTKPGFTAASNLVGIPAATVPCGFDSHGMPIGLHLSGAPFDEVSVLKVAHTFERATTWHGRRPGL